MGFVIEFPGSDQVSIRMTNINLGCYIRHAWRIEIRFNRGNIGKQGEVVWRMCGNKPCLEMVWTHHHRNIQTHLISWGPFLERPGNLTGP